MKWRSKKHRQLVASHGCCIPGCSRQPVDAHHLRIGHGMGMKAGDEWCVPLCRFHHTHGGNECVHHVGSKHELEWFADRGIDAIALAKSFYEASPYRDECNGQERRKKLRGKRSMPGSRASKWKRKMNGTVVRRDSE